jgi:hypothetical protein
VTRGAVHCGRIVSQEASGKQIQQMSIASPVLGPKHTTRLCLSLRIHFDHLKRFTQLFKQLLDHESRL